MCYLHITMIFILVFTFGLITADQYIAKAEFKDSNVQEAASKGLYIGRGRTKRFVELDGSQKGTNYPACELPDGKPGLCKPPNLCMSQDFNKNYITFTDNLCINEKKIGICCPSNTDGVGSDRLAGDLPAIAAKDEEAFDGNVGGTQNRGCGLSTRAYTAAPGTRITIPKEWPWMVSITPTGFEQYCGGVLVTESHVLTAAHCTKRWQPEELEVRLGEYDFRRTNDSRSFNFKVVSKREHEFFDISTYWNDIAILKLHRPAVFSTYVWPICLTPVGLDLVNQTAYITGWGTQKYKGMHSTVLMEVSVPIWDLEQCIDSFTDTVFEENICAGDYGGGKDACQGDSGGPLMYQMSSGRWAVIGIVSWGVRCGEPNHPGVYTRVDKYLPWIIANTAF